MALPLTLALLAAAAVLAAAPPAPLLPRLPGVVHDDTVPIDIAGVGLARLTRSLGVATLCTTDPARRSPCLEIRFPAGESHVDYALPLPAGSRPWGERLRFWLKGDETESVLRVWRQDRNSLAWEVQAEVPATPAWQHIEVAASQPVYAFYASTRALRFSISGTRAGAVRLAGMEWVSPRLLPRGSAGGRPIGRVFTSWGGPSRGQIQLGARAGSTFHFTPMAFPDGDAEAFGRSVEAVAQRAEWCHEAGIQAGIQFYNNPTKAFAASHRDLFPINDKGVSYYEYYAGGACLSPWNPSVQALWRKHITATLAALKQRGVLALIDGVWLSPGEEGELCYQWDSVWAFDPYAIAAYRQYLRRLYGGKIAGLNADWGTGHASFDVILPPGNYAPDRQHWVFQDFYRWSMLRWCVQLADAVREVHSPKHWLWLPHTLPDYPKRYHSARYPGFYVENLAGLGVADLVHIAALDWQGVQDVATWRGMGVQVIGEIDVQPTLDRQRWTFEQSRKFGCDGVYLGTLENLSDGKELSPIGLECRRLTSGYRAGP